MMTISKYGWCMVAAAIGFFPPLIAQTYIHYAPMTINNLTAWYSSDGGQEVTNGYPKSTPGATFPMNTAGVSYASGFMYAVEAPTPVVNGYYYISTLQQGSILGLQTGVADDKFGTDVRIWRVRKDFAAADLRRDAALTYRITENSVSILDMQRLRTQYKKDWIEWPAAKGAPYYDVNNNGIYDPKFIVNEFNVEIPDSASDSPGLADADQVIWYVCNDLGDESPFDTPSIGMEMQITVWGYKTSGAINNTLYRRCRMIYKGTSTTPVAHTLTNMYIGIWADLDLGQFSDDLAGSDSLAGLGYVYNSRVLDTEFAKFNTVPPSVGYDILQGPIVKGTSLDSALVNFSYRKGWKNLPVSSVMYSYLNNPFAATGSFGAQDMINLLKGIPTRSTTPALNPTTNLPTTFTGSGDPISKTGWIDGVSVPAGDREVLVSSGPFSMTLGDTQEVVTAFIAAQSPDRLASVGVLKYYDNIVQDAYSKMISPPPAMPFPAFTASELDRSILFEWEKDTAGVNRTEKYSSNGYVFEGYELFQLPSPQASKKEWITIATYDLKNEVTQIVQDDVDPLTGRVAPMVSHNGKNAGITRYLLLNRDSIRNAPMINGQQYHFALVSYAFTNNAKALRKSIESEPAIITVTPHVPDPELNVPYAIKDSLVDIGENVIGHNDGRIGVKILDPYSVTGGSYDVWYGVSGAAATWTLVKSISGTDYASITARLTASELTAPRPNPLPLTTGTALFTLNDARDRLAYSINVNTGGTVTSIEFYSGQKNTIGLQAKKIVTNSKTLTGVWTMSDAAQPLSEQLISDFIAGYLFVLVRTVQYPNGEMRGQLFDGMVPRATLPIPEYSTSDRSVLTFTENRLPREGFSVFVSPAPIGFRSGIQTAPTRGNVINQANNEKTYTLIGPGFAWGANRYHESVIEFRFTNDTNWAITTAATPAETKFIRVPFQVWKDSIRVVPVIENRFNTDSSWNIKGNSYLNGQPLFDKIVGITDAVDFSNNDISYSLVFANGTFPTSNSMKGRLINGVNHIARNIVFVNTKGDGVPPSAGTVIQLTPYRTIKPGEIKRFTLKSNQAGDAAMAKKQIEKINVFPNPYYGVNIFESGLQNKYVTFSHLPNKALIKIYNLAGIHVRSMRKEHPGQFMNWDLKNQSGNYVASGVYLAYIDMDGIGSTVIKLAVIMEHQQINSF